MAKQVIRYLLEGNGSVPTFVEDGGYFRNGAELVGISVDETVRYLPASVHRMDEVELLEWIKNHYKDNGEYRLKYNSEEAYNDADMEAICEAFLEKL